MDDSHRSIYHQDSLPPYVPSLFARGVKNRWKVVGIFLEIENSIEARKRINYEISTQLRSHRVSKPNLLRNIDFTLTLFTLSLHIDSPSSRVPTRIHIYTIRTRR